MLVVQFEGSTLHVGLATFCSISLAVRIVEKNGSDFCPGKRTLGTAGDTSLPIVGRVILSFGETWPEVSTVEFFV